MDPVTHVLASYTLKRSLFPRATRSLTVAMLFAGTLADLDNLSAYFGPSAFLRFYRTGFHSLALAVVIATAVTLVFLAFGRRPETPVAGSGAFLAALVASVAHVLLDFTQSDSVELLWPVSPRRRGLDWTAHLDLWIAGIFLAALVIPKISSLVGEEIGAKARGPRGRVGATVALVTVVLYVALRAMLHGNAIAALESRSYRGETPRRSAALPDDLSLFRWYGVVETERALHSVTLGTGPGASFDPEGALTSYKPEPSVALDAARDTGAARRFLAATRFPKASLERVPAGFRVELRPFPSSQGGRSGRRVMATIETDPGGKILSEELVWEPGSPSGGE